MGKKKDSSSASKKIKSEKSETGTKGVIKTEQSPAPTSKASSSGYGSLIEQKTKKTLPTINPKKAMLGGILALALSALSYAGMNMQSESPTIEGPKSEYVAPRAASEAAPALIIPQPLAPEKKQLAEPKPLTREKAVTVGSKDSHKKAAKLTTKAKSKDTVKKVAVNKPKQKAVKQDKKAKKTLAAKTMD